MIAALRARLPARGGIVGLLAALAAAGVFVAGTGGDYRGVAAAAGVLVAWLALPPAYTLAVGQFLLIGAAPLPTAVVLGVEAALGAVLLAPAATERRVLAGLTLRLGALLVAGVAVGAAWLQAGVGGAAAALVVLGALAVLLTASPLPLAAAVGTPAPEATAPPEVTDG